MMFFRCSKDSFYRFFSFLINLFVSQCMMNILCFLYISFPSMLITCGFDCICENMLMFPFSKLTAFRISYTAFVCFDTGRNFF